MTEISIITGAEEKLVLKQCTIIIQNIVSVN